MDGEWGQSDEHVLSSLLYVSRVQIESSCIAEQLSDILTVSIARNTAFNITGLLIATPRYFAQLMEGALPLLDSVMARILEDARHCDIQIVLRAPLDRRIGGAWRLIRFEAGSFEERHVTPPLERAHRDGCEANVAALMALIARLLANTRDSTIAR